MMDFLLKAVQSISLEREVTDRTTYRRNMIPSLGIGLDWAKLKHFSPVPVCMLSSLGNENTISLLLFFDLKVKPAEWLKG